MSRKQILIWMLIAAVLAGLVYWQVHSWRKFDWEQFRENTEDVNWGLILAAIVLIHAADALRAVRWSILLEPVKRVPSSKLVAPQFIGFAALALLGRPGELIRPYLIARRVEMRLSSQMAVWTVERIFDIAAVTLLLTIDIIFSRSLRDMPEYPQIRKGGLIIVGGVLVGIAFAVFLRYKGAQLADWSERRLIRRAPRLANKISVRLRAFSEGLNTIRGFGSLVSASLVSIAVWMLVAGSYRLVTFAYHEPVADLGFSEVVLLMFFSIAGGVIQLPMVGGGSQFATIAAMQSIFGIEPELATSCGILLWLVTFVSITPLGLILAHREHVSLRELEKESHVEAEDQVIG